jgi:hypothetical protein
MALLGAGREPPVPGSLDRPGQPRPLDPPDPPDGAPGRLRPASTRSDSPTVADRADGTEHLATGDPPARWSKADLHQRLERLPPGHPSSLPSDAPDHDQPPGVRDPDRPTSAENAEEDSGARRESNPDLQADAVKRDYWSELPRFLQAWADHIRTWPGERAASVVDRSQDQEGSWRGDGAHYLNPEQHREVSEEITRVREIQKGLTEYIVKAEQENACGGWLEGLDHHIKSEDRIKEKVAEIVKRMHDKTAEDIVRELPDVIRYTFCFEPNNYATGYWDVKQRLEQQGHSMVYSKNHWQDDPEYKGINTRWDMPGGQRFELQFHTPESYCAKQEVTHGSYERLRYPLTQDEERRELRSFQREVCRWIGVPEGAAAIPDYPSERP